MRDLMGRVVVVLLVVAGLCGLAVTEAAAQSQRALPSASDTRPFVEQADGGAHGQFQLLNLGSVERLCQPYTGTVTTRDQGVESFAIYDKASGHTLIVRPQLNPYNALLVVEWFQSVWLRPHVTWTPIHLDGDGVRDLIGHDAHTGQIVRVFRRGCQ